MGRWKGHWRGRLTGRLMGPLWTRGMAEVWGHRKYRGQMRLRYEPQKG